MLEEGNPEGCPLLFQLGPILYDSLRFTIVFPDDCYCLGVEQIISSLSKRKCDQLQLFNFWPATSHRLLDRERSGRREHVGIHAFFEHDHFVFEVQFHTETAVRLNQTVFHPLYDQFRKEKDPKIKEEFRQALISGWGMVPMPQNAGYICGKHVAFPAVFTSSIVPAAHGGCNEVPKS